MFLENRGNGSWRVTVQSGLNPDGTQNRFRKTIKVDSSKTINAQRREAEKQAAVIVAEIEKKLLINSKKLSIKDLADEYMENYARRKNLEASTQKYYRDLLDGRIIPYMGRLYVQDLTARDINKFYSYLANTKAKTARSKTGKLSGTMQNKYHTMLHSMLAYAVKVGYISVNPADQVEAPKKDTQETQWYEIDESAKLLDVLDNLPSLKWKTFFYMAIYTGCRPGELIGLNWKDINDDKMRIHADAIHIKGKGTIRKERPKTKSSDRYIVLPKVILDLLNALKIEQGKERLKLGSDWGEPDAVFTTREGKRMNISSPTQKFQKILNENNLSHLTLYGLRHTNATILIANGASVRDVAAHLGHSQTSTTMNIYAHALKSAEKQAADMFTDAMQTARKNA